MMADICPLETQYEYWRVCKVYNLVLLHLGPHITVVQIKSSGKIRFCVFLFHEEIHKIPCRLTYKHTYGQVRITYIVHMHWVNFHSTQTIFSCLAEGRTNCWPELETVIAQPLMWQRNALHQPASISEILFDLSKPIWLKLHKPTEYI